MTANDLIHTQAELKLTGLMEKLVITQSEKGLNINTPKNNSY